MAQERSDLNSIDRVDPADYTESDDDVLEMSSDTDEGEDTPEGTDEILEQIEETRSQMGETIDAIQDRLSFSNLSEQVSEHVSNAVETAKDAVYDATIGKAAIMMKNLPNTNIVRTVKRNPLPFVLIGAGAGLLAYQAYAGNKGGNNDRRRALASAARDTLEDQGSMTDTARETLHGVTDRVSNVAGSALNRVSGVVDTTYNQAGEMLSKAKNRAGEVGSQAYDMYDHYLEENPLAVGAVALALGAAVGFAIPSTDYEAELMGDARNQLMEKAQGHASNLLDQAKQAVTEATQNISSAVGSPAGH
jgi:ElaB/YqjD/DUF883 family membrane-anchored ribosome-binding protein